MKCLAYKMSCLWNVLPMTCLHMKCLAYEIPTYEMSCLWNVLPVKCLPIKCLSCLWNVLPMKYLACELSCLWYVLHKNLSNIASAAWRNTYRTKSDQVPILFPRKPSVLLVSYIRLMARVHIINGKTLLCPCVTTNSFIALRWKIPN